ncbi:peptide chain release factor N(5)-glutamine methyltransferase [Campylobacter sp. FMV-PI01]|uniref:peptide chain release factor N(5)-glutamine methyltransferase n=1 Tax=Campylobacter portucalensis TaxID=2608384 RepID=A0A6L5WGE4_9BACT|nr:peptide chain release factor N(5)-glutamine methyltransferase [Campylobacter portucalensis]MSN96104.1 peptide chain release factor N(5)-glutamine methyltransferase [Campylobacter portucalensis]
MKVFEAFKFAINFLDSKIIAKELLKFHLKLDDNNFLLNFDEKLSFKDDFIELLKRYKNGEPLEYITKRCEFFGDEFYIEKGVLIPRFETEILVENVLEIAQNFQNPKICEIGFGSGIISLTLKKHLKNCEILATDISKKALKIAKKNALNFDLEVEFLNTSLMDGVCGNFDIIVSNPPYIKNSYKIDKWVANEPKEALFGGENGDEILKDIIKLAKNRAKFLACEIGYDQKNSMQNELINSNFEAIFYKDLAGFDRGFIAKNRTFDD